MATVYRPIDAGWVEDARIRALVDEINRCLRDWGAQFNTTITQAGNSPSTSGVVSSIQANATAKRSGPLTFANTSTITVQSVGAAPPNNHIFTWHVDTAGLASILGALPNINYGTTFVEGTDETFIRTDATLEFPESLGAVADRTDTVTLTDDGSEGALLTASNAFAVNGIALKAPNATNTFRIGKYGNVSIAGAILVDTTLYNATKTDYNETTVCRVQNWSLTNSNVGSVSVIVSGFNGTLTGSCSAAAASTTNSVIGGAFALSAGNPSNNNFLGNLIGYRVTSMTLNTQTAGTAIPLVVGFEYGSVATPVTATRATITDNMAFRARMGATLLTSATITNATGFRCEAITAGTNRYGVDIAAFTTGTPTVSYGVQVGTHSVGTTRRSFIGGNTFHCTANDFACDTAAKGFIAKDGAGTPHYWRYTVAADGTPRIDDTGTALPTT